VNRQEHLLSIAHTELEWGVFHRCEDSVEKTTSISEPITSLVEANHWPNVTVYGKAFANQPWHSALRHCMTSARSTLAGRRRSIQPETSLRSTPIGVSAKVFAGL
jgi:hypothetical protein